MKTIVWDKTRSGSSSGSAMPVGFLGKGEIHVWKARLDSWDNHLDQYYAILSTLEKERADRFRFAEHRQRFIAAHALLRQILGAYCSMTPAEVAIQIAESGKPGLKAGPESREKQLYFNLSHSDRLMLLTVGLNIDSGVDLERIRPEYDEKVVSQHFFSKEEQAWLEGMPAGQRKLSFFQLWTCKEAVLKAEGGGIRRNLGEVEIVFEVNLETAQCRDKDFQKNKRSWSLRIFSPEMEYTAALAFENDASAAQVPDLKFYQWTG